MRDSFSFVYTPNAEDTLAGMRLAAWGSPAKAARTVFLLFVLPSFIFGTLVLPQAAPQMPLRQTVFFAAVAGGLWAILFAFSFRAWLVRYILKRERELAGTGEILVSVQGVERRHGATTVQLAWSGISSIQEHERAFLLMAGKRALGSIEKSAIPSATELAELRSFLQTLKPFERVA